MLSHIENFWVLGVEDLHSSSAHANQQQITLFFLSLNFIN